MTDEPALADLSDVSSAIVCTELPFCCAKKQTAGNCCAHAHMSRCGCASCS